MKLRGDALALAVVCGVVAYLAPEPWWQTDRGVYERMGREWLIPGCNDFHCFRPLVSWMLGLVPGPSIVVWKGYAVVCQVGAGLAMAHWVMRWGVSMRTARMTAWLTALGSGACYTFFDPYTSDPLMHLLGPLLMLLIDLRKDVPATVLSMIGVMAKEFAAVPVIVGAAWRAVKGERQGAIRLALGGALIVGVWTAWQLVARLALGYSTGPTYSADLTTGGYVTFWLLTLSPDLVARLMAMVLGGLWLLWAAGLLWGPRNLRGLTLAAMPAILIFNAVQQPDRALWNFAFVVMPAAALLIDRAPALLGWLFVAAQVILNVRFGGQLLQAPPASLSILCAIAIAIAIIVRGRPAAIAPAAA